MDLLGQRAIGGDGLGAGPERAFVRGQADRPLDAGSLRFAADIGGDVEDARPRDRGIAVVIGSTFYCGGEYRPRRSLRDPRRRQLGRGERHGVPAEPQQPVEGRPELLAQARRGADRRSARNRRSRSRCSPASACSQDAMKVQARPSADRVENMRPRLMSGRVFGGDQGAVAAGLAVGRHGRSPSASAPSERALPRAPNGSRAMTLRRIFVGRQEMRATTDRDRLPPASAARRSRRGPR